MVLPKSCLSVYQCWTEIQRWSNMEEKERVALVLCQSKGEDSRLAPWELCLPLPTPVSSVQFSLSLVSNSLRPHGLQHARLPCPSPTPRVWSNSCPLSWWCHPAISSPVVPFSSHLQSFPASGSFPVTQFFASGGQSIGASASASVLPMNTQDWSPLGWTGWISLQSKGLSRVFSSTTVQKHQFFRAQLSLWSDSHIHTPWHVGKGYIVLQEYVIRIKAATVLYSFLCSCIRVGLLTRLGMVLGGTSPNFDELLPQMVSWLLLIWLATLLPFGNQRKPWRLESCLQGMGDNKASMPKSPTRLCSASMACSMPSVCFSSCLPHKAEFYKFCLCLEDASASQFSP